MTGISDALAAALPLLSCPACAARDGGDALSAVGPGSVGCAAGHRFDVARQGYLSLLGPRARTDTGGHRRHGRGARRSSSGRVTSARSPTRSARRSSPHPVLELGAGPG